MENIYTIASSSASTTYGNIMAVFKQMLLQNFSVNYFKDVYISSEIAYTNIRRRLGRNTINEMRKLERPYMSINPILQAPNSDMYLYDIPLTKNFDNMEYGIQKNTLFPILNNSISDYTLFYKLNRDQIQFDITITVDTLIQQLDLYKYMINHFVWERPFSVRTSLESMIPKEMIMYMGKLSNIEMYQKDNNNVPVMLQMMNRYSRYPITYKMRTGTSLDEFFLYYNAEILVKYEDLSIETVNRRGMADDFYQLTFRATVDFNLPGVYVLCGEKPRPSAVSVDLAVNDHGSTHDLIPLYTINNLYSKYSAVENGFILYTTSRFQTERDPKTKKDTLNLDVLFEKDYIDIIRETFVNNVPMETLVKIILVKDEEELTENTDWYMKWNNLELTINNADDKATYRILIYINNNIFNEKISDKIDDKNRDKDGL